MKKFIFAKKGKNALKITNPNDSILDSTYNSPKIIKEGTSTFTLTDFTSNQTFRVAHGLPFTPLVTGFAKQTSRAQVFPPNMEDVTLVGPKVVIGTGVIFNYIAADAAEIIFNFSSDTSGAKVDVHYYCLESI